MAIFQLFEKEKQEEFTETFEHIEEASKQSGRSLFSTVMTRFCFLLLMIADLSWLVYNTALLIIGLVAYLITGARHLFFKKILRKFWLHFIRSLACGLSLFVGLFSPPFGIMIACTYFLMYDKAGMEEVVPVALQSQFKDVFKI